MIKLVKEVGQQNQIEPVAPVDFERAPRHRVIALRHPGRLGTLSCDRKDGLPIDSSDFRVRNGSCNRDAEHTVARRDIEHLARGPARQLGCDTRSDGSPERDHGPRKLHPDRMIRRIIFHPDGAPLADIRGRFVQEEMYYLGRSQVLCGAMVLRASCRPTRCALVSRRRWGWTCSSYLTRCRYSEPFWLALIGVAARLALFQHCGRSVLRVGDMHGLPNPRYRQFRQASRSTTRAAILVSVLF